MDAFTTDPVTHVLAQLLRQPEPQRDIELERALLRLQAARSDSAYLLLHRVMVLEAALQQLKQAAALAAPATQASATAAAPVPARSRSFLRDAAVVAAGVVGGQVLFQGLSEATGLGDAADAADGLGFDLEF